MALRTTSFRSLARKTSVIRRPDNVPLKGFHTSPQAAQDAKPSKAYPHYPSVQHLLRSNNISDTEAAKIPASGPNNRLLKGDVLAYLGSINSSYPSDLSARLTKLGHLDLSNIQPAAPTPTPAPAPKKHQLPQPPDPPTEIALPISLLAVQAVQTRVEKHLGIHLLLSTFISRATELSNIDLPRPKSTPLSTDELFDAVVAGINSVPKTTQGRFIPHITPLASSSSSSSPLPAVVQKQSRARRNEEDIYDLLSGTSSRSQSMAPGRNQGRDAPTPAEEEHSSLSMFKVSAKRGDELPARTFLERVKSVLEVEPGRLIL